MRVSDLHFYSRPALFTANLLNCTKYVVAANDFPEHHMFSVEPRSSSMQTEELARICGRAAVSHRQYARPRVLEREILVGKLVAIDRLSTCSISSSDVSTLSHKLSDNTMERRSFIMKRFSSLLAYALFSCAQSSEIFSSFWNIILIQLEHHPTYGLVVFSYIKEN